MKRRTKINIQVAVVVGGIALFFGLWLWTITSEYLSERAELSQQKEALLHLPHCPAGDTCYTQWDSKTRTMTFYDGKGKIIGTYKAMGEL